MSNAQSERQDRWTNARGVGRRTRLIDKVRQLKRWTAGTSAGGGQNSRLEGFEGQSDVIQNNRRQPVKARWSTSDGAPGWEVFGGGILKSSRSLDV